MFQQTTEKLYLIASVSDIQKLIIGRADVKRLD